MGRGSNNLERPTVGPSIWGLNRKVFFVGGWELQTFRRCGQTLERGGRGGLRLLSLGGNKHRIGGEGNEVGGS